MNALETLLALARELPSVEEMENWNANKGRESIDGIYVKTYESLEIALKRALSELEELVELINKLNGQRNVMANAFNFSKVNFSLAAKMFWEADEEFGKLIQNRNGLAAAMAREEKA